jgi:hypothetical protein
MPLIEFLAHCREPMPASLLWREIEIMRANKLPVADLPPTKSEMERQLRLAKSQGLVREEWPKGASEGLWSPSRAPAKPTQGSLFG